VDGLVGTFEDSFRIRTYIHSYQFGYGTQMLCIRLVVRMVSISGTNVISLSKLKYLHTFNLHIKCM
jgi:hypothetical protein